MCYVNRQTEGRRERKERMSQSKRLGHARETRERERERERERRERERGVVRV